MSKFQYCIVVDIKENKLFLRLTWDGKLGATYRRMVVGSGCGGSDGSGVVWAFQILPTIIQTFETGILAGGRWLTLRWQIISPNWDLANVRDLKCSFQVIQIICGRENPGTKLAISSLTLTSVAGLFCWLFVVSKLRGWVNPSRA